MPAGTSLKKTIAEKFDDEVRFFRGWLHTPKAVGSIVPTSSVTARRMASVADPASGLPVLELGPGTGVITKALLARGVRPEKLVSVEYSKAFVEHLRRTFPDVRFIHGDAFDLDGTLGALRAQTFDCVISGIPLLNFPVDRRVAYIEDLLGRIPEGRPIMQITYGALSPVPVGKGDYMVERFDFVIRNIPPAHLWIYRRANGRAAPRGRTGKKRIRFS
jgi:phosphatidylethanolamine/phosphatidyl-N-methylethanolamine N-methyltransferase